MGLVSGGSQLRRDPVLAAAAAVILALSIGANTTVFSLGIVHKPMGLSFPRRP